ncbi:MAG: hypothetical protein ACYTFY_16350 [Planctomycetota bacterium]|jgi:hypothetical protein
MDKKMSPEEQEKLKAALGNIQNFQNKMKGGTLNSKLLLDIPLWRLAVEGIAAFTIAFICGKGLGIFYQVIFGS